MHINFRKYLPTSQWSQRMTRCLNIQGTGGFLRIVPTTCCSTSEQTTLLPPTCTSMGLLRILRAKASIALGKVAENITVCLSGRTLSTMRMTWENITNKYGDSSLQKSQDGENKYKELLENIYLVTFKLVILEYYHWFYLKICSSQSPLLKKWQL